MDAAQDGRRVRPLDAFLAGLQAGMLGTLWMLVWMGLAVGWQRRSFWTPENLMASVFHPRGEITLDFGWDTISGLALYVVVYSLVGAGFGVLTGGQPMRRARTILLAVLWAVAWYYFSFHLLWNTVAPAIAFLGSARATITGHVIYGLVLGRFHTYLPRVEKTVSEAAITETAPVDSAVPKT